MSNILPRQPTWRKSSTTSTLGKAEIEGLKLCPLFSPVLDEMESHVRDVLTPAPVILAPSDVKREKVTMDDVSDFPKQKVVDLAESRPYEEGKYRPPSMPSYAGIFPTHIYLNRGKSYDWCGCGHS